MHSAVTVDFTLTLDGCCSGQPPIQRPRRPLFSREIHVYYNRTTGFPSSYNEKTVGYKSINAKPINLSPVTEASLWHVVSTQAVLLSRDDSATGRRSARCCFAVDEEEIYDTMKRRMADVWNYDWRC